MLASLTNRENFLLKSDYRKTLLITSATSGVGLAVIDSVRNRRKELRVIGVSTEPFGQLSSEFDEVIYSPSTDSEEFPIFIESLCQSEKVDLVIAGRDDDIMALADSHDSPQSAIRLQSGPGSLLKIFRDKYLAFEWCKTHNIEFAESIDTNLSQSTEDLEILLHTSGGFPLVLKPRCGDGSRGVHILRDEEDLRSAKLLNNHIFQEFVGKIPTENIEPNLKVGVPLFWNFPELEQGVIVLVVDGEKGTGETFTCIATHSQGVVNKMWRNDDSVLLDLAKRILGELLAEGFDGICNFSAMKALDGTWKVIEINPRFTGGTASRLLLGFDEVGKVLLNLLSLDLQSALRSSPESTLLINRKARDIID